MVPQSFEIFDAADIFSTTSSSDRKTKTEISSNQTTKKGFLFFGASEEKERRHRPRPNPYFPKSNVMTLDDDTEFPANQKFPFRKWSTRRKTAGWK